ncbi:MAG: hypothetical protein N2747_01990 [Chitinophagaceae bacterium]|nr:hypothetical protein [Chitinophagaceae bacterium]
MRNFVACRKPGSQLYIRLFKAISRQKKYDESAILKKFCPSLNKKNISFQKNYLLKQITEALSLYDRQNENNEKIYQQVQLIRILRKKGLIQEANEIWKKAIADARRTESFAMLNLLKTEFEKILLLSDPFLKLDELYSMFHQNLLSYNDYAELFTLRDIYTEAVFLRRRSHYVEDELIRNRIEQLLQKLDTFDAPGKQNIFWYSHYYHVGKALLLYLSGKNPEALDLLKKQFEIWTKNSHYISTHGEFLIELLYMINYAGIAEGDFDYVVSAFQHPVCSKLINIHQVANFEAIKYLALNKIYNKTGRYEEVKTLVASLKKNYQNWQPFLNKDLNMTVCLSLGIALFVLDDFNEAFYYIKKGINEFREGIRREHEAIGHLLLMLVAYCMKQPKLFESEYRSAETYFRRQKKSHPFESALAKCLHKTFYMSDWKSKAAEYKKTLELFDRYKDDLVQQRTFQIFNYYGWLQSQIKRINYREYVKQNLKSKTLLQV